MDIGFGALIDQVEKHLGRKAAKWTTIGLVILVCLAIIIAIREAILAPISEMIGASDRQLRIATLILIALSGGIAAALSFILTVSAGLWAHARRFRRRSLRLGKQIVEGAAEASQLQNRALDALNLAQDFARRQVQDARERIEQSPMGEEQKAHHLAELDAAMLRLCELDAQREGNREERDQALRALAESYEKWQAD